MLRGIKGMALIPSDLFNSIEAVSGAGYDVIELWAPDIVTFLDLGHTIEEIAAKLESVSLKPHSIVAIENADLPDGPARENMIAFFRRMCKTAKGIGCSNIQVVTGSSFKGSPWQKIRKETAKGLRELTDIASRFRLTIAY